MTEFKFENQEIEKVFTNKNEAFVVYNMNVIVEENVVGKIHWVVSSDLNLTKSFCDSNGLKIEFDFINVGILVEETIINITPENLRNELKNNLNRYIKKWYFDK